VGWEGERRQKLHKQRAAQLSAAAELASEQGANLSSGPADPILERWLKRQLAQEGERLQKLQQRFWEPIALDRLDRVLVLSCRSLLWALPALAGAREGGVLLQVEQAADAERLQAQLAMLDQLNQPRLCTTHPHQLTELLPELASGERFELLLGRNVLQGSSTGQIEAWVAGLDALISPMARLDLLFSAPQQGPAGLLPNQDSELLKIEQQWLQANLPLDQLSGALQQQGWELQWDQWQETVSLLINKDLLQRWFEAEATYLRFMKAAVSNELISKLEQNYRQRLDQKLPQTLLHQRLFAIKKPLPKAGVGNK
jgi:putative ATPase